MNILKHKFNVSNWNIFISKYKNDSRYFEFSKFLKIALMKEQKDHLKLIDNEYLQNIDI